MKLTLIYVGDKIVQESGDGDITDIRMIASGSGYTTLFGNNHSW